MRNRLTFTSAAEKFLESVETQPNYSLLLLQLVGKDDVDATIRVAGSIAFKNFVKRNWNAHADAGEPDRIVAADRDAIKHYIVTLMLKSSPAIQKQLSDAVSIIGKYDFPAKWPQLIGEMVEKFGTGDFHIINGILQTAHSIFKRYRYEFKSQKLWEEIKFVLDTFAKPLTELLVCTLELTNTHAGNEPALKVIYSSLGLIAKVFYSLNAQDLPEFFEDNMQTWMNAFHVLLTTDVPCLQTGDDEEAGILELLRSQICDNLGLYAQKYDEEFGTYMQQFVTDVWGLLVKTGIQTKYDAVSAIGDGRRFCECDYDCGCFRAFSWCPMRSSSCRSWPIAITTASCSRIPPCWPASVRKSSFQTWTSAVSVFDPFSIAAEKVF